MTTPTAPKYTRRRWALQDELAKAPASGKAEIQRMINALPNKGEGGTGAITQSAWATAADKAGALKNAKAEANANLEKSWQGWIRENPGGTVEKFYAGVDSGAIKVASAAPTATSGAGAPPAANTNYFKPQSNGGNWVQRAGQWNDDYTVQSPSTWVNTGTEEVISDAQYKEWQAGEKARTDGIRQYFGPTSGLSGLQNPQETGGYVADMGNWVGSTTELRKPTPEMLAKGANAAIDELIRLHGGHGPNAARALESLKQAGYFTQFAGWGSQEEDELGKYIRAMETGQNPTKLGMRQSEFQTLSVLGAPFIGYGINEGLGALGISGDLASTLGITGDALPYGADSLWANAAGGGTGVSNLTGALGDVVGYGGAGDVVTAGGDVFNAGDTALGGGGEIITSAGGDTTLAGGDGTTTGTDTGGGTSGGEGGADGGGADVTDFVTGGAATSGLLDLAKALGFSSVADLLRVAGGVGAAGIDYAAADKASERLDALARDYMALGAPSRERYEASFDPNFDVSGIAGFDDALDTSYDSMLRGLSTKGNPFGNPGGLAEAMKYVTGNVALPAISDYRRLNAGAGGLAALTSAAPHVATQGINADASKYDSLGFVLGDLTNPRRNATDLYRQMGLV